MVNAALPIVLNERLIGRKAAAPGQNPSCMQE